MIAVEERDIATAREWYVKSLAISDRLSLRYLIASNYHQLGMIAQEEGDFATAREWYLKSIAVSEKQGDLHGAAFTYGQLGLLAGLQGSVDEAGMFLVRSITSFSRANDQPLAQRGVENFLVLYERASAKDKRQLEAIWREVGLGAFSAGGWR